jgi:hypothetical protein
MIREMLNIYNKHADMFDWEEDTRRSSYLRQARSNSTCKNRKRKKNMLHVKRAAKLKKRRS